MPGRQMYRMRTPSTGRESFVEAEPGRVYTDRETGEHLEVVGRVLPLAPSAVRASPGPSRTSASASWCEDRMSAAGPQTTAPTMRPTAWRPPRRQRGGGAGRGGEVSLSEPPRSTSLYRMHFRVTTALLCACCALLPGACGGSSDSAHDTRPRTRRRSSSPRAPSSSPRARRRPRARPTRRRRPTRPPPPARPEQRPRRRPRRPAPPRAARPPRPRRRRRPPARPPPAPAPAARRRPPAARARAPRARAGAPRRVRRIDGRRGRVAGRVQPVLPGQPRRLLTEHRDYDGHALDPESVDPDPLRAVAAWLEEARAQGVVEPEAMTVSTVDARGRPSSRYVLLRGIDERGLTFFTNYASDKARDLAGNPHCALTFGWLDAAPLGPRRGRRRAPSGRRERRLLRRAPAGQPHRRLGLPAELRARLARRARRARHRDRAALRGHRRRAAPRGLGRLPGASRARRAVAGAPEPPARPRALSTPPRAAPGRGYG